MVIILFNCQTVFSLTIKSDSVFSVSIRTLSLAQ